MRVKSLFEHRLALLDRMISKIPEDVFSLSLSDDMFSLAMNAKIASNFVLRGYCPLLEREVIAFDRASSSKTAVQDQITDTRQYLNDLPDVGGELSDEIMVHEKAGLVEVKLPQPEFLHNYIIPNFFFHMSMVYAIARANGVNLSKGDFDGIHYYPEGFSFKE